MIFICADKTLSILIILTSLSLTILSQITIVPSFKIQFFSFILINRLSLKAA